MSLEATSVTEVSAALEAVATYVRRAVAPLAAHPERTATPKEIEEAVLQARGVGLLGEGAGLGLWESAEDAGSAALSARALALVAEASAGVAYHLHGLALGAYLIRRLRLPPVEAAFPLLQGRAGLGRGAMARLLAGRALDAEDRLLLQDHFPAVGVSETPNILQACEGWEHAVVPFFEPGPGRVRWALLPRDGLQVDVLPDSHGLDETRTWIVRIPALPPAVAEVSEGEALAALIAATGLNALAMMAIGQGGARAALARARRYAAERVQGGRAIGGHPAVQLLLGRADANVAAAGRLVEGAGPAPESLGALAATLRLRAVAHTLLCGAATDALQVFGGYGYMRDFAVEKILRDNRHLKLSFGAPRDIELLLGAFEGRGEAP